MSDSTEKKKKIRRARGRQKARHCRAPSEQECKEQPRTKVRSTARDRGTEKKDPLSGKEQESFVAFFRSVLRNPGRAYDESL